MANEPVSVDGLTLQAYNNRANRRRLALEGRKKNHDIGGDCPITLALYKEKSTGKQYVAIATKNQFLEKCMSQQIEITHYAILTGDFSAFPTNTLLVPAVVALPNLIIDHDGE